MAGLRCEATAPAAALAMVIPAHLLLHLLLSEARAVQADAEARSPKGPVPTSPRRWPSAEEVLACRPRHFSRQAWQDIRDSVLTIPRAQTSKASTGPSSSDLAPRALSLLARALPSLQPPALLPEMEACITTVPNPSPTCRSPRLRLRHRSLRPRSLMHSRSASSRATSTWTKHHNAQFGENKEFAHTNESSFLKASNTSWLCVLIYGWANLTIISVHSCSQVWSLFLWLAL
jgi:hypothetical protein